MKKILALPLVLALSACTMTSGGNQPLTQAYDGPALPDAQVARLYCAGTLTVHSVDGNKAYNNESKSFLGGPRGCNFALKPGLHLLLVSYSNATTTATGTTYEDSDPFPAVMTAEAGKIYTLKPVLGSSAYGMRYSSIRVEPVELPAGTPYNADRALRPR